ncbi:hypothetical protein V2J09_005975, partial [Rumex salicifolius]
TASSLGLRYKIGSRLSADFTLGESIVTCPLCSDAHLYGLTAASPIQLLILQWILTSSYFHCFMDWALWLANTTNKTSPIYGFQCTGLTSFQARNRRLYQDKVTSDEECYFLIKQSMIKHLYANWKHR